MAVDHDALEDMYDEIRNDPRFAHLRTPGIKLVPGIGADEPLAMVIGEAPGATENRIGEPFCGVSGKVLHQLMDIAGLYAKPHTPEGGNVLSRYRDHPLTDPPNVWLTNAIKFRPPGNRTPNLPEQIAAQPYLSREWRYIGRPRLIVCVGAVAAGVINADSLQRVEKGTLYRMRDAKTYIAYQYHPAFGLRSGKAMQERIEEQWALMGEQIQELREELRWT